MKPSTRKQVLSESVLIESVPQRGRDIMNKLLEVYSKEALEDRNLIANTTIQFIDDRLKFLTSELSSVERDVEQYKRENELTDVSSNADQYLTQASEYTKQLEELRVQIEVLESIETYINKQPGKFELVPSTLTIHRSDSGSAHHSFQRTAAGKRAYVEDDASE